MKSWSKGKEEAPPHWILDRAGQGRAGQSRACDGTIRINLADSAVDLKGYVMKVFQIRTGLNI